MILQNTGLTTVKKRRYYTEGNYLCCSMHNEKTDMGTPERAKDFANKMNSAVDKYFIYFTAKRSKLHANNKI